MNEFAFAGQKVDREFQRECVGKVYEADFVSGAAVSRESQI